jgi:transcription antitermination factor NusG
MDKVGSQPHVISDVESSHQRSQESDCENKPTKQPEKVKIPISDNVAINQSKFNF